MNVDNFVAMSMYLTPFAFLLAPMLLVTIMVLGEAIRSLVQVWYAQRVMRKGAICYRRGNILVVYRTK